MHRRHLLVDGQKMSKSKKNFYTVDDLVERVGPAAPRALRYLVLSAHYRTPIDFTWAGLEAADKTLQNLDEAWARLEKAAGGAEPSAFAADAWQAFGKALDEDLETSQALAAVHDLVRRANQAGSLRPADAASALAFLRDAYEVLGLAEGRRQVVDARAGAGDLSEDVRRLLAAREAARKGGDWAASDRLRDELLAAGVRVKDTQHGQEATLLR
jgi:cysteinyl-tRNA synthetase